MLGVSTSGYYAWAGGLRGVTRRWVTTTRRDPQATVAADKVRREFCAEEPNRLWVADITYVPTAEGFVCLATVLDVFSRKVVGWTQSVTGPSRRASGTARNAVKRVPAHRAWGSESARPRPVGHETTNVPGGRGTRPPSPRHLLQTNPIPPTHSLLSLRGKGQAKLNVTSELQMFGLIVTAEPYFAVCVPSDLVIIENEIRKGTKGRIAIIDTKYELDKGSVGGAMRCDGEIER